MFQQIIKSVNKSVALWLCFQLYLLQIYIQLYNNQYL